MHMEDAASEYALVIAREAIDTARGKMTRATYSAMVEAYWTIGKEIVETVGDRAEYGKGFSEANLRNMRQFYHAFSIRYALRSELSWTRYRLMSCRVMEGIMDTNRIKNLALGMRDSLQAEASTRLMTWLRRLSASCSSPSIGEKTSCKNEQLYYTGIQSVGSCKGVMGVLELD